ncbi:MAG: class II aldolase [Gammaproteobacteria bacterium]|nr:MAG: class II aldolase [Gammaproteobacteria bacterium]
MSKDRARSDLVAAYRRMTAAGLGTGSSGNLSLRTVEGMLITPTGVAPAILEAPQVVAMSLAGQAGEGQLLPSSEWHIHTAIYRARPDINAVVHCHSRHATILACAHRPIPAVHYMIAIAGVDEIPVAPYATFGTEALAGSVAGTLGRGRALLLANHGQIALGVSLDQALAVAVEVEELAAIYWGSLAIGGGKVLSKEAMMEVRTAFADYGQQHDKDTKDNG